MIAVFRSLIVFYSSACTHFSRLHLHSALINDMRTVFNVHRNRINILLNSFRIFVKLQYFTIVYARSSCLHFTDLWDRRTALVWKHAPRGLFRLPYCHCVCVYVLFWEVLIFWTENPLVCFCLFEVQYFFGRNFIRSAYTALSQTKRQW